MKPKVNLPTSKQYGQTLKLIEENDIKTICQESGCPNISECFSNNTATFLILGDTCTRNCRYCSVKTGTPGKVDGREGKKIADAVKILGLKYVVLTSVDRDDLPDGGAQTFVNIMKDIRKVNPDVKIELLTPDFRDKIKKILFAKPYVFGHNIETVKRIFPKVRPQGKYIKSLVFLKQIKEYNPSQVTKTGFMVGLGETKKEIFELLDDLKKVKVDIVTIGQYLQPTKKQMKVEKFYTEEEFEEFQEYGEGLGMKMFSGPLVRSSYHAEELK